MKRPFYGSENASEKATELYDALSEIWAEDTCAPRMRDSWTKSDKTKGQCSITAFLVSEILGGEVYGIQLEDGNYHCFNVADGVKFDLTSEQFKDKTLDYENAEEQFREIHFAKKEKEERYCLLKKRLFEYDQKWADAAYESAVKNIKPGKYRHYKGNEYEMLYIARHSETLEPMVVYRALYGNNGIWVRPAYMWNEKIKGGSITRFEKI